MQILVNNNYIEVECPHCRSKLGVHQTDIRYSENGHNAFTTTCGACGSGMALSSSVIPKEWMAALVPDEIGHH